MNKFELVSSVGHQMSETLGLEGHRSNVGGLGCILRYISRWFLEINNWIGFPFEILRMTEKTDQKSHFLSRH